MGRVNEGSSRCTTMKSSERPYHEMKAKGEEKHQLRTMLFHTAQIITLICTYSSQCKSVKHISI